MSITWEEISARDVVARRSGSDGDIIVRAFDFTPVPYDPEKFNSMPAPVYDTLNISSSYDEGDVNFRLTDLDTLLEALHELRDHLVASGSEIGTDLAQSTPIQAEP